MKIATIALAALLALGSATAHAGCAGKHACADGFSWSSEAGTCVPKTVSS